MMIIKARKNWLLAGALVFLIPVFSVAHPSDKDKGCSFRDPKNAGRFRIVGPLYLSSQWVPLLWEP